MYWRWMIVSVLLESLDINDNKILSGIRNYIPNPSNLCYVVNKSREAKFMSIAGFVCNYPCGISCYKIEHAGLGRIVKEIYFWDGK